MVTITLGKNEALVLFDFLSRYDESDVLRIDDSAEQYALWAIHGLLEKTLVEPLDPEYVELVGRARADLRARFGGENDGAV